VIRNIQLLQYASISALIFCEEYVLCIALNTDAIWQSRECDFINIGMGTGGIFVWIPVQVSTYDS
jgi:hypothetical protein